MTGENHAVVAALIDSSIEPLCWPRPLGTVPLPCDIHPPSLTACTYHSTREAVSAPSQATCH